MENLVLAAFAIIFAWRYLRYPTTWLIMVLGYLAWRWVMG